MKMDKVHKERRYRSIVVVDLDGTLTKVNTWRCFAKYLLRTTMGRGRLFMALALSWMLLLRRLKVISHRRLKRSFMLRSSRLLSESDFESFADDMAGKFDSEVLELVWETCAREDAKAVLATAAAGEYAPLIARRAGIDVTLCTREAKVNRRYEECRGRSKADRKSVV